MIEQWGEKGVRREQLQLFFILDDVIVYYNNFFLKKKVWFSNSPNLQVCKFGGFLFFLQAHKNNEWSKPSYHD